jgi:hypothetical protein
MPEKDFVSIVVADDERKQSLSNADIEVGVLADGDLRPVRVLSRREDTFRKSG